MRAAKFINIEYEEGQGQDSYERVTITLEDDSIVKFETGDFEDDWNDMSAWLQKNSGDEMILSSSSVDDFFYEEPQRYMYFSSEVW